MEGVKPGEENINHNLIITHSLNSIPLTPLLPALPQIYYSESGASDVTCGWLYRILHHLWHLIPSLKWI